MSSSMTSASAPSVAVTRTLSRMKSSTAGLMLPLIVMRFTLAGHCPGKAATKTVSNAAAAVRRHIVLRRLGSPRYDLPPVSARHIP